MDYSKEVTLMGGALILVLGRDRHRSRYTGPELFQLDIVWFGQKISYTGFGEDKLWLAGVCFDFFPQAPDMNPEAINGAGIIFTPHFLGKAGVGRDRTSVFHQVVNDVGFDGSELYLFFPDQELVRRGIKSQRPIG